jgi:hypothetical protein
MVMPKYLNLTMTPYWCIEIMHETKQFWMMSFEITGLPIGYKFNEMKFFARRFLLVLMMLWLPVQGVVAAFTPHCEHQSITGYELNTNINLTADNYLHNVGHQQPMDGRMASDQPCEVNTLCHASCSTLISAANSTNIPGSNSSVHQSRNLNTASFIPDLPQHPPRV